MRANDYPEILAEMIVFLAQKLREHGLDESSANEIAISATDHARAAFAGQIVYIPLGGRLNIGDRDKEIYSQFNGSNIRELVEKYGLSMQRIYKIIAKCRAKNKAAG